MKRTQDTNPLNMLCKIYEISAKKHTVQDLLSEVQKCLRKFYRNTKVSVIIGQFSVREKPVQVRGVQKARSFEEGFSALVAKTKKAIIVSKRLNDYCKRNKIAPVHRVIRSVMGVPMLHHGELCGVIVLQKRGESGGFTQGDASLITLLARQLAAEISYERLSENTYKLLEEIKHLSLTDSLTNMPNRRFFDLILDIEWRKAKGYTRQLSLAMISPDRSRTGQGRQISSTLLLHVATTLKRNVRDTDFTARFGGDKFAIILPEAVNESAVNAAERVRKAVERTPLVVKGSSKKKVTISVGVVTYPSSAENLEALLHQAIKALSRAKQLGQNQVVSL
jgi:diguanylate cyclase (GGDEF)-like protein